MKEKNDLDGSAEGAAGAGVTARRWRVYAMLVGSMALWGGTWPVGRLLAGSLQPWNAALMRFVLASLALVLICVRMNGPGSLRVRRGLVPRLLLLGATGIFGYSFLFFSGLKTTEAGRASLIVGCIPVCIALASAVIERKRTSVTGVVGIILSLLGVALVIGKGDILAVVYGKVRPGDIMIMGCVVFWTAYTLLARPVMKEISPLAAVTWSCIFGTIMILPFSLFSGLSGEFVNASRSDWFCLLYLGVAATALAYYWYYNAINRIGAVASGIFINLVPLFALLFSCLFLKEALYWSSIAGGMMIISGVVVTVRSSR